MNIEILKQCVPASVFAQIPFVISGFSINTALRLSHFLGQCGVESANFTVARENMNYSDVNRIAQIFRKYVDSDKDGNIEPEELENAKKYVHNPEGLANFVYANRNGNGDAASGDGYRYRGAGYIQLTGKANFKAFGDSINVDTVKSPELVATTYPLLSAAWFFSNHNLNNIADNGIDDPTITKVTKVINGGTNALTERIQKTKFFYGKLH